MCQGCMQTVSGLPTLGRRLPLTCVNCCDALWFDMLTKQWCRREICGKITGMNLWKEKEMEEHSKWRIPGDTKQVITSFVSMAASELSDLGEYKEICVLARMHMQEKDFEKSANEMELSLEMFGDKELELTR